jgi:hypothetical protein
MAMRISTEMALQPKGIKDKSGINSDIVLRYPFAARYRKGLPPEPGDIPPVVNISGRHGFPDAMGCGFFWVLSPRLLEFIREANGPQWPLHACEITLVSKSIGAASYMISRRRETSMDKSLSRPKPPEAGAEGPPLQGFGHRRRSAAEIGDRSDFSRSPCSLASPRDVRRRRRLLETAKSHKFHRLFE